MSLIKVAKMVGLDLSDEKDFDEAKFKEHLDKTYVSRELAASDDEIKTKISQSIFDGVTASTRKALGLSSSEVKGKTFEEILEAGKTKFEAERKTWEEKSKHTSDDRVTKLEKELETERQWKTEQQEQFEAFKQTTEKEKAELFGQVKSVKLNHKLKEIKGSIPFTDDFLKSSVAMRGFDAILSDKYAFDLDENEEPIVTDKAGKPIKHPTNSQRATVADVFKMEAEANKFLKKNNASEKTGKKFSWQEAGNNGGQGNQEQPSRVHPNARKREEQYGGV